MHIDNVFHRLLVRELDEVEEAAAQERVRKFFLIVRGDDHDWALFRLHGLIGFVDVEFHTIELLQKIVREFDIGFIDFVDQKDWALFRGEGFPEFTLLDVVLDVLGALFAHLTVAQTRDRIILIQALSRFRGRFDVPLNQLAAQRFSHFDRQHSFTGARLTFDQKRAFQLDRGVDGHP